MFRSKVEKDEREQKKAEATALTKEGTPKKKQERTKEEWNLYMKEYRQKNLAKMQQIEKCKYYKRKNELKGSIVDKFGMYSADAIKTIKAYRALVEKKPELRDILLLEILGVNLDDSETDESEVSESD
jgi:hypothetical protein|tara:strand:- start:465 stop:848 length:384 start_codon:yes stop_codon:yes gene_type:complete